MAPKWLIVAANDIWNFVVPLTIFIFWVVVNVFRGLADSTSAAKKNVKPARPAERRVDPQRELERFLEEVGLRKSETPRQPPPPPQPRKVEQAGRKSRKGQSKQAPSNVAGRHIHSKIEDRRADQLQSQAGQRSGLAAASDKAALADQMARLAVGTTLGAAKPHRGIKVDLLHDRDAIVKGFIFSTLFAPPLGVSDPFDSERF